MKTLIAILNGITNIITNLKTRLENIESFNNDKLDIIGFSEGKNGRYITFILNNKNLLN